MRMSCNGCRVLRKGCGEDCIIRPCLQWIKNPESQANATVFLAKFYGRAGLLNLIAGGHQNHRPAIFRSLLYEACGRIVNPVYGSVGLLWSGSWHLCQAAVEAVLKGAPIIQMSSETIVRSFDIRHVSKEGHPLKRPRSAGDSGTEESKRPRVDSADNESSSSTSHELLLLEQQRAAVTCSAASSGRDSEETADGSMVTSHGEDAEEVLLDLTLGLAGTTTLASRSPGKRREPEIDGGEDHTWAVNLRLDLAA